jgi:hypothetical protein
MKTDELESQDVELWKNCGEKLNMFVLCGKDTWFLRLIFHQFAVERNYGIVSCLLDMFYNFEQKFFMNNFTRYPIPILVCEYIFWSSFHCTDEWTYQEDTIQFHNYGLQQIGEILISEIKYLCHTIQV